MAKYCNHCGIELTDDNNICPQCEKQVQAFEVFTNRQDGNMNTQPAQEPQQDDLDNQRAFQPADEPQPDNFETEQAIQPVQARRLNITAFRGFIIACISLLINFWGIVGIVALVMSIMGFRQISNTQEQGKKLAIAGIIIGAVSVMYGLYQIFITV